MKITINKSVHSCPVSFSIDTYDLIRQMYKGAYSKSTVRDSLTDLKTRLYATISEIDKILNTNNPEGAERLFLESNFEIETLSISPSKMGVDVHNTISLIENEFKMKSQALNTESEIEKIVREKREKDSKGGIIQRAKEIFEHFNKKDENL